MLYAKSRDHQVNATKKFAMALAGFRFIYEGPVEGQTRPFALVTQPPPAGYEAAVLTSRLK
jgi:hypothetical protein